MSASLLQQLESDWAVWSKTDSPAVCDRAIEATLCRLVYQARGTTRQRLALATQATAEAVTDENFGRILELSVRAIVAWYESDFETAAQDLLTLARSAVQRLPKQQPCQRAVRLHALCWAAACWIRLGKLNRGLKLLDQASRLVESCDMPICCGWYHAERGRMAYWQNDFERAHSEYVNATGCFQEAQNHRGLVKVAVAQARLYTHRGLYDLALQELAHSEQWRDSQDALGLAQGLFHRARIFRYREDYAKATGLLTRALPEVTKLGNKRWEANIRDVLGDVYLLSGDLKNAGDQYGARVFSRSSDPIVNLRTKYREVKLQFAKATLEASDIQRSRDLRRLVRSCESLLCEPGRQEQMIEQKVLLLKGRILQALGDFANADSCFQLAAKGFTSRAASWYRTEALWLAGHCRLAARQGLEGVRVLLLALQGIVDEVHRTRILERLKEFFEQEGVGGVCERLTELYDRQLQLTEAKVAREKLAGGLRAVVSRLAFLANHRFAHIRNHAPRQSNKLDDGYADWSKSVVTEASHGSGLLELQCLLLQKLPLTTGGFNWLSLADTLKQAGGTHISASALKALPVDIGLYTEEHLMVAALNSLFDLMATWTRRTRWHVEVDRNWACITATGNRHPPRNDKAIADVLDVYFNSPPLDEYDISNDQWAGLQMSKVVIEAAGGRLLLSESEPKSSRVQPYQLEIRLPVEEIPL